jgi:uncharacterized heparinase superfamily protein
MPAGEIRYRIGQGLVRGRLRCGWRPWPSVPTLAGMADLGLGLEDPAPGPWEDILRNALDKPGHHALLGLPARDLGDPPNWFIDPITGGAWPSSQAALSIDYRHQSRLGEVKYIWEVARMPWLLPRALAARALGHERLARRVLRDILDFVRRNPPLKGIHWTSGIEFAWRAVTWCFAIDLVRGLATPRPEQLGAIATHLGAGAELCLRLESRYSSANNHLVAEGACLEVVARAFPALTRAPEWLAAGRRILDREIPRQILPDGSGCEFCPAYLLEVLEWALVVATLRQTAGEGLPSGWRERFGQSARYLSSLCAEGEHLPLLGDSDDANLFPILGETPSTRVQEVVAALRSWSEGVPPTHQGVVAKLLRNREAAPAPVPPRQSAPTVGDMGVTLFPDAGQAVLRSGSLRAVLECGPHGLAPLYAHAHSDAGSLVLDWAGTPVLVDPGTYCYHGERDWRDWFRSAAAHNLVQLNGREQARILGPFMWDQTPQLAAITTSVGAGTYALARHSAYAPWHVERRVSLPAADRVRVEDRIICAYMSPALQRTLASVRWQFAPGRISADEGARSFTWSSPEGVVAVLQWHWDVEDSSASANTSGHRRGEPVEWQTWVVEGDDVTRYSSAPGHPLTPQLTRAWVSPRFSIRHPAPALVLAGPWSAGQILVTEINIAGANSEMHITR